ncbi:MAG TPA: hypothetical protein VG318_17530 [Actinomycetota bacterium]|nr:hypothetical protein [Actinomycetota bacterium]
MRRIVTWGLLMLLVPACAFEAASYPVEPGPPRPAVCRERPVDNVCFEMEQFANTDLGWIYMSEEELLSDEPLGRFSVDPRGRLRYEFAVTARDEDVGSVKDHYMFFLAGRMNDWRRVPASPPWDVRLVTRPTASFETNYEILFDLTPRGRHTRVEAVMATLLPAEAIARGEP